MRAGVGFGVLVHDDETIYAVVKTKLLEVLGEWFSYAQCKSFFVPRLS